jgi:NADPH:quinone reductase-like Zn-dependent oxidoreductase
MLQDNARLGPDNWVLVMGASGELGSAGIQAAQHLGARVIATTGADECVRAAGALGADFGINYHS